MEAQGVSIKKGNNYDGVFRMLDFHRFNFLPRGVNEVFGELEQRKDILQNVVIEPNLSLYIPTATYILFLLNTRALPNVFKKVLN